MKSFLNYLEQFKNLMVLRFGNRFKNRIENGYLNRFYGSLYPLRNMINLQYLNIEGTDISSGLEYLTLDNFT